MSVNEGSTSGNPSVMGNKSKLSLNQRKIESARPNSGPANKPVSRPTSSMAGLGGGLSKKKNDLCHFMTLKAKENGIVEFEEIPVGNYLVQFDGYRCLKPVQQEIFVQDRDMKVKIEINMIDEAYFIIRYKDGPPEEKYEFSLVPKDEEENVLLSMPIVLTQTDKNEHICVVEPGDYYLITKPGVGNVIEKVFSVHQNSLKNIYKKAIIYSQ